MLLAAIGANAQGVILHGNGDPRTKVPIPNCAITRFYVDDSTGQMYTALQGSPCSWDLPAAQIPGLAGDGNNGVKVTGPVATPNVNGSVYASQYATGGTGTPSSPWTSASGTGGIQEAITAVGFTAGNPASRTVWISPGYYSITASIVMTAGINLLGTGWDSVLYVSASLGASTDVIQVAPTAAAQVKGFRLEDFTILPVSGTPGRYGILLDGTSNEIQQGLIHHVNIHQLGNSAIGATGSGAAQGTPVLTTINDSILTGGFSCTACGDSVTLRNNQMAGTGANVISFQTGATGFIFDSNNVTLDGGSQIAAGNTFAPKFTKNEFESQPTFTGSNASLLDFDGGSIIGGVVRDNTFNVISPLVGNGLRLNHVTNVIVEGNTFTRGAAGSMDITLTSNSSNNQVGTNFWNSGGPLASMVGDAGSHNILFFPYLNGTTASGPTLQTAQPLLGVGSGGTTYALISIDSANTITVWGYLGAKMIQQVTGTTLIWNGTNGQDVAALGSAGSTTPGSSTVGTFYNYGLANGHVLFSSGAPTIASGFGTSPSVAGVGAYFTVNVGTGGTAASGVLTMPTLPTAATAWHVECEDATTFTATVNRTRQTTATTTTVTIGNFDNSAVSQPWASGDSLTCHAWAK